MHISTKIMLTINYYLHILLTNRHFFIIKLMLFGCFYFILYIDNFAFCNPITTSTRLASYPGHSNDELLQWYTYCSHKIDDLRTQASVEAINPHNIITEGKTAFGDDYTDIKNTIKNYVRYKQKAETILNERGIFFN